MGGQKRKRWQGSAAALANVFGKAIEQPTDVDYDASDEAMLDKEKLHKKPLKILLCELLDDRMNFKRSDVQAALGYQYCGNHEWPKGDQAVADYRTIVNKRLMNALEHFKNALLRKIPARWATDLLALEGEQEEEEEEEKKKNDPEEAEHKDDEFFYGYSPKCENAYRVPAQDSAQHPPEYALVPFFVFTYYTKYVY